MKNFSTITMRAKILIIILAAGAIAAIVSIKYYQSSEKLCPAEGKHDDCAGNYYGNNIENKEK